MVHLRLNFVCSLVAILISMNSYANAPKVGKNAAAKYFQSGSSEAYDQYRSTASDTSAPIDRFLSFGAHVHTKSDSYSWGNNSKDNDVAKWGIDVGYRISQYNALMDYSLRISYQEYEPIGQKANKLSFQYAASFPDVDARFPLYFGASAGLGVFLTQIPDESPVSFDYQLFAGARVFDVFERTGFYVEGGLKNHLQLTSSGQLNGTYVGAGAVFTF